MSAIEQLHEQLELLKLFLLDTTQGVDVIGSHLQQLVGWVLRENEPNFQSDTPTGDRPTPPVALPLVRNSCPPPF